MFLPAPSLLFKVIAPVLLLVSGCAEVSRTAFPVDSAAGLPENVRVVALTPQNIGQSSAPQHSAQATSSLSSARSNWQYNIGVGDVLSITVWDYPELTLPAGPQRSQLESGSTVNESGDIFYPYLGQVRVAGRLVGDVQRELTTRLAEFFPDPQIEVKIAAFNAQKAVVTGAVAAPQSLAISNIPLTLLEAINAAGGLKDDADSQRITIRRAGRIHRVDLKDFLEKGNADNNPLLRGGDVVNVPVAKARRAYILGQITRPGIVELGFDGLNLTEALTMQGGLDETKADAKGIFVFRGSAQGTDVFQLDATTPLAFVLATRFYLRSEDVVYIVADPASRWNDIIGQLIPTIGAVRQAQLIGNDL